MVKRGLWIMLGAIVLFWPLMADRYVSPRLDQYWGVDGRATTDDLQLFFGIRRYHVDVPAGMDGWSLELTANGRRGGYGGSFEVRGGTRVIILVQITPDDELRYCWHNSEQSGCGTVADAMPGDGVRMLRPQGEVRPGDWLIRGTAGGGTVSSGEEDKAPYEVRLTLEPQDTPAAEHGVAPKPPIEAS